MLLLLALAGFLHSRGWWADAPEEEGETGYETVAAESASDARPRPIEKEDETLKRAREAFGRKDYITAITLFQLAQTTPNDPAINLYVGVSYYRLGEYENARRHLEQALAQPGDHVFEIRRQLAFTYHKEGDLARSMDSARQALALKEDADLENLLAQSAREMEAQGAFVSERSEHFIVQYDGRDHWGVAREALNILDEAYLEIGRAFDYFPDKTVTVILYTKGDFQDVLRRPAWVEGAYDGTIRIPVRGVEERNSGALRHVLYHEYAHAYVHSLMGEGCPRWVNEGLAEYLSVGRASSRVVGQAIPLSELEEAWPTGDEGRVAAAYRESHRAMTYLAEKYGIAAIKRFLLKLGSGRTMTAAFEDAFGSRHEDFLKEIHLQR